MPQPSLLIPLVGSHFHPPAKLIIPLLATGTELSLIPEFDNPYDPEAIQVWLSLSSTEFDVHSISNDALMGMGLDHTDLENADDIMLGFLARQRSPEHPRGPLIGHRAAHEFMATNKHREWIAKLSFDPNGKPLVNIKVSEQEAEFTFGRHGDDPGASS